MNNRLATLPRTAQRSFVWSLSRPVRIAWGIIIGFLALWEAGVRLTGIPQYLLPAPSQVLRVLYTYPGDYAQASLITLGEALGGLILGVTAGFFIASLLTLRPGLESGVMLLAILIKSTPMVAIAPLLTIWLGFGAFPKVLITGLMTFFPVLVNVLAGMQRPDPALMDLFRSWRAGRWEIFLFLRLPTALPYLFAALKITAPLSIIGAVVAEWTGASGGLGRVMWLAYTNLNLPFLFAAIFILAAAGMSLYVLLSWAESRVIFWNQTSSEQIEDSIP